MKRISIPSRAFFAITACCALGVAWLGRAENSATSAEANKPTLRVATKSPIEPEEALFVGKETCRECHAENFHLHGQSGHASTFALVGESHVADKLAGKTLDAGEPYGLYHYERLGDSLVARRDDDPDGEPFPLQYALGSGHHAVTMLSLFPDAKEGTIGLEHRVSWFAENAHLGLTPGHAGEKPDSDIEHYGNLVTGDSMHRCVECHTTNGKIVGGQIEGLIANVNCEKCHGPGSVHVQQARASKNPPPFSVGKSNWTAESELQLCGSCHRLPIDISPKQLREYPLNLAKFQPVGMVRSACYLESEGAMRCTTCHNPHQTYKAKSKADYVADCVGCHNPQQSEHVLCSVSTTEGCIECHMPPLEFEEGMIFHDHWIRVIK